MADVADLANDFAEAHRERSIRAARQPIPVGVAGDCDRCGNDSLRLVGGLCAPCRDGRRGQY